MMHCGEGYGSERNVKKTYNHTSKRPESNRKSNIRKYSQGQVQVLQKRKTSELSGSVDRKG